MADTHIEAKELIVRISRQSLIALAQAFMTHTLYLSPTDTKEGRGTCGACGFTVQINGRTFDTSCDNLRCHTRWHFVAVEQTPGWRSRDYVDFCFTYAPDLINVDAPEGIVPTPGYMKDPWYLA